MTLKLPFSQVQTFQIPSRSELPRHQLWYSRERYSSMVQRNLYEQSLERQAQAQQRRSQRLANSRANRRNRNRSQKRPFQNQSIGGRPQSATSIGYRPQQHQRPQTVNSAGDASLIQMFAQSRQGSNSQRQPHMKQNYTSMQNGFAPGRSAPMLVQPIRTKHKAPRSAQGRSARPQFMQMPSIQAGALPRRVASRRGTPRR